MANINNDKKQQAQFLYMAGGKTQKEIADLVGVSERTIHSWVHQFAWDKLRLAAYQAPITIADNLCSQLVELQNDIAKREPGKRYPTPQEAETIRKLIVSLERMKKYPSLSQNMQVLETFRDYMRPLDRSVAADIARYANRFVEEKAVNGYAPYQAEYGVETISPVMPFYDEVEGLDADEHQADREPCTDIKVCLHTGKCRFPRCGKPATRVVTKDDYKVTPVAYVAPLLQPKHAEPAIAASVAAFNGAGHADDHEVSGSVSAILKDEISTETTREEPETSRNYPANTQSDYRRETTKKDPAIVAQAARHLLRSLHIKNTPLPAPPEDPNSLKNILLRTRDQDSQDHAA